MRFFYSAALVLAAVSSGWAAEFFVAPDGSDSAAGTREAPFATVQRAQTAAQPGDTVTIRGGTYAMREDQIATLRRGHAFVTDLGKSGRPDAPITYRAAEGEKPVFDFTAVKPAGRRVSAFHIGGDWIRVIGLEVTGVQVTIRRHTQSICFYNRGSHNRFERLVMRDGMAIGYYLDHGSDNLVLNCDAFRNHDPVSEDGRGGNVDGFGAHPDRGGTGNVFRGCRAWHNSDDGYDCINAHESVLFENCWAGENGFSSDGKRRADGNGFKAGGYASTPAAMLPRPVPRHIVRGCISIGHPSAGFYANHHVTGGDWFDNRAFRNGTNFNFLMRVADNTTDIPGIGHLIRGNIGFGGKKEVSNLDPAKCELRDNSFTGSTAPQADDFRSLDPAELLRPRNPDGSLPATDFMRMKKAGK